MEVVYRVDALKRTNVGNHLRALDELNAVHSVLTQDANEGLLERFLAVDDSSIPEINAPVHSLPPVFDKASNHVPSGGCVADYYLTRFLSDADAFIGWSGMSPFTLERAVERGMETFIVRASPHILEDRRAYGEEYRKFGFDPSVGKLNAAVECFEYQLADHIIVPAEYCKRSFGEYGVDTGKVHVVPFECGIGEYTSIEDRSSEGTFTVCTATTIDLMRGVHHLLQSWEEFADGKDDVHLQVAGKKNEPFPSDLYDRVEARDDTTFHGYVNDVGRMYAESDAFVLTSLTDGGPCGPLEAMGAGLPVIVSETMGVEMDVEDGTSGYVIPRGDVDATVDRLERLYESPELRREMGSVAKSHAKSATDREAKAFKEVIQSTV